MCDSLNVMQLLNLNITKFKSLNINIHCLLFNHLRWYFVCSFDTRPVLIKFNNSNTTEKKKKGGGCVIL